MNPPEALESLDAEAVRSCVHTFRDALRAHQEELNRLNVYPVPDGDTGTNMALTLESVCSELEGARGMEEVCTAVSHGSLMGARGNSGVILSQILRGLANCFSKTDAADAACVVAGLREAADAAYQAVMRPVEGTILTVVRETAEAGEAWSYDGGGTLTTLLEACSEAASAAVQATPDLLPVLKEAGVVDAGGHGFTLLIDAMLFVVDGRAVPEPQMVTAPPEVEAHLCGEDDVSSLRYEVMYLLEAEDHTIPGMKEAWASVGDSIVVVGGDGMWNCHVHTNEIGAAIEAGIQAGRPRDVRVTDLFEEAAEERWVREADASLAGVAEHEAVTTGVVAVAVGEGVRRLFSSLGVQSIVAGGQSMNPSTAQILDAVHATRADGVVVLPDNKNIIPVAAQVAELSDRPVEVVPTRSVVEGLSALVAYDPDAPLDVNAAAMADVAERVRVGEVTSAVRDADTPVGRVTAGDWIGLDAGGICATASDAPTTAADVVDRLVDAESELVTVVVGEGVSTDDRRALEEQVALRHPELEIEVHDGGQPLYPFLLGVE
ncbi:MAG: DAK2 domain-containing protein [Acidimicrobiia bacterium]|nr:DAK2 domain-containing protein [Acidimicrobiia bacterium]